MLNTVPIVLINPHAEFAEQAAQKWDIPVADCSRYLLEECHYELGPLPQSAALMAFRDRAARLDLCAPDVTPAAIRLPH